MTRLTTVAAALLLMAMTALAMTALAMPDLEAEVHLQYFRLVRNEAGVRSVPDADGIWQSLTSSAKDDDGQVHLERVMSRMARHSSRTFPIDSPWRRFVNPTKLKHRDKLRTRRNAATVQLGFDCARPAALPPAEGWSVDACLQMVDVTRGFVRGKRRSRCKGKPTTWGSIPDVNKRDIRSKMREINCDRVGPMVPGNTIDCDAVRADRSKEGRRRAANTPECSLNSFWSWNRR